MTTRTSTIAAAALLALVACTEHNELFDDPTTSDPCETGRLVVESFDLATPDRVDILFVVDNSDGMASVQQALAQAMPRFVQNLNAVQGLDYQLGVTSTDIVDRSQQGELQNGLAGQAGCPGDRPLIITRNTPSAPTVAACNVVLGEEGDDFEAGLEAVRFALLGPAAEQGQPNEDFARSDARLVVVIVSNENDCSSDGSLDRSSPNNCEWDRDDLIPLDPIYIGSEGFFTRIKNRAGQPVDMVAIVGPDDGLVFERPEAPQAVCASNGQAYNGRRYLDVAEALGDRGGFYSVCNRSYEVVLRQLLDEHIAPRSETVCPFLSLTQEPVSVRLVDGEAVSPIPNGPNGYLYLGAGERCASGRVQIGPDVMSGTASERLEIHYCTEDPIPE